MPPVFKPIRPKKLSEEIVSQIKNLIGNGDLKPGERIPSERELATFLGVSRPSVREAIMVLEAMGFLESRQGGGTYVRSLTERSMADPLASMVERRDPRMLHALTEVRMGLETWSAYLAAKRAEDSEIARLRELYEVMEEQAESGGWDPAIDAEFHLTITAATHNTLQVHVLDTIQTLFQTTIMVTLGEFYTKEGYIELLLNHHREILEAIAAHDPERARQKMMEHLTLVEEKLALFLHRERPDTV
ncbi:FadR/GntR family transcriptional regulator [Geopsychrobacter electrodiphilus]|uniref:FadR/GntR family transcriptional regulator n=1 Tax=Geopsychrobacter electrodiphilus TaxID=225196 RepID=UPI0003817AE0|nr:FadR/GntR family transcriptional regulator [Geopsychrobacter electrodiphilus]